MPDLWGLTTIATKLALYLGVLGAVGTVFAAVLFRLRNLRGVAIGFAALGLGATVLGFSLAGAALTGDASGMIDPEMLALLWSTPVGTAVALRLIGLGLLSVGLFAGQIGQGVAVGAGLLALWSFVHIGHIADRGAWVLNLTLAFHLVAIALWIGVLTPLRAMALDQDTRPDAAALGHRFGAMAAVFVPLLILAGGYMGLQLVGSVTALIGTSYGLALVVKVLCVAGLLALAAANKLRFVPRIRAGDPNAARHLATSITLEWIAVVVILLVTAVLTSALTLPS